MARAGGYGALLDALRGVTWPVRRTARGGTAGTHRSRLRGLSPEFTEYRPYRQGDDPRRLDWKLLARTDRAFLRVTSDRTTLGTWIVVDASASMAFPERTRAKWAQACRVAVGLTAVALGGGDPVGIVVPAGGPEPGTTGTARILPPRTRRGTLGEVARLLDGVTPEGSTALAPALALTGRAARLAIVTDLLGDADALLRDARKLVAAGADVHLVHVVAREELEPVAAAFLATDPEEPSLQRPLGDDSREAYLGAFDAFRRGAARAWREAGATYTEVAADEPAAHAVRRITVLPLGVAASG